MRRSIWLAVLLLLAVFAVSPFFLVKIIYFTDDIFLGVSRAFFGSSEPQSELIDEVMFVGDVMLARHVETLMNQNGSEYPYQHIKSKSNQLWVGNFEAAVPNVHKQTPDFTFTFSVAQRHLAALQSFGFSHLGLANNHTYDFGKMGFEETINNLSDFKTFGNPTGVSEASITYIEVSNQKIALVAINAVSGAPEENALTEVLTHAKQRSDFQIVYVHWGEEYKTQHNSFQEAFAHTLVELDVDAVIGHHPHVVQDIGVYEGKPIFYSLGNFIFDQYFRSEVQQGLVLSMKVNEAELEFTLLPITSLGSPAAPSVMEPKEQSAFLLQLAQMSEVALFSSILNGRITAPK